LKKLKRCSTSDCLSFIPQFQDHLFSALTSLALPAIHQLYKVTLQPEIEAEFNNMKFSSAALLMLAGSTAAFSSPAFSPRSSTAMSMSAVQTPTYTFTKSEEIFAEAKEVSSCYVRLRNLLVLSEGCENQSPYYPS
jgi:hypothetical protein